MEEGGTKHPRSSACFLVRNGHEVPLHGWPAIPQRVSLPEVWEVFRSDLSASWSVYTSH